MKMFVAAAALALLTAPVLAQSSPSSQDSQANKTPQTNQDEQANSQASTQSSKQAALKIKQDLQKEGFTDVNVVAESFVVQGKSPDGDPVVMTIGPHGMSVFEAMNAKGSDSGTVGSNNGSSGSSGSNSSTNPSSGTKE